MGAAEILYETIRSEADLDALIAQEEPERLHLDFKTKADVSSPGVDSELRRVLGKALSGFANADGGVLILGVDAPSRGPIAKTPISALPAFEQAVNTQIAQAVQFPVRGVVTRQIPCSNDHTSGFLLILVPQSDLAPHRSQFSGEKLYYTRSGDSFLPMEHFQVADAFGRRHVPVPGVTAVFRRDFNAFNRVDIQLNYRNSGRAIAAYPMLQILDSQRFTVSLFGIDGNRNWNLHPSPQPPRNSLFSGGANEVVHAGTSLLVAILEGSYAQITQATNYEIRGRITANGVGPHLWSLRFSNTDLHYNCELTKSEWVLDAVLTPE